MDEFSESALFSPEIRQLIRWHLDLRVEAVAAGVGH
jgi:hypothetical protein